MPDPARADDTVLLEMRDGVAHVTLNRPGAGNALNVELARDLEAALRRCREDEAVRAVVLAGAGANFCVGGDLKAFTAAGVRVADFIGEILTHLHPAVAHIAAMRAPVIAAVHGAAAGGGMSLACACDLIVAAESARFTLAYTRIGLALDGSSSYSLPRLVGQRRALELALTNRTLSAQEALDWGLITAMAPDAALADEAAALARMLAGGAPLALGAAKRLLRANGDESLGGLVAQMDEERRTIQALAASHDGQEGIAAFLARRPPNFTGR
ncbi:MAG TPA: enoyl-CoA hydratase-related protein [Ktedonobacterales bacterium]|jgi:2-(1,2-epoxy-1,2-dihydrophenyl)acetyl-CoA isomerase